MGIREFAMLAVSISATALAARSSAQPITGDLVLNTVNASPSAVQSGDSIRVDFSIFNAGPGTAQISGYTVLVDGSPQITRSQIFTTFSQGSGTSYTEFVTAPTVPSGATVGIDVEVVISEVGNINTSNNSGIDFVTVSNPLPDITFFTPTGWSGPAVLSTTPGTTTSSATFTDTDTLYLDFAVINAGGDMPSGGISVRATLDGSIPISVPTPLPGLSSGDTDLKLDSTLGPLTPGNHTILIELDHINSITEQSETNNSLLLQFAVESSAPDTDLAPYTPPGWPAALYATDTQASPVPASTFETGQDVFVYGAFANYGTDPAGNYTVAILVDGAPFASGTFGQFNPDAFELPIVFNAPGQYTFTMQLDSLNAISETNENNNEESIVLTVTDPPCPPDVNNDGVVDNGDISDFIALFLAQDPASDFTGDGIIDNGDIGAFIAAFLAGC